MERLRSDQRVQRVEENADAGGSTPSRPDGVAEAVVTGWRGGARWQQVFEEAAVDLGNGLKSCRSRVGKRKGKRVGFPRFKKKAVEGGVFRLRNNAKGKPDGDL